MRRSRTIRRALAALAMLTAILSAAPPTGAQIPVTVTVDESESSQPGAPSSEEPRPGGAPEDLPTTGVDALTLAAIGLGLVAAGLILCIPPRPRRRQT